VNRSIPPAIFIPPAYEPVPDLAYWTPSDKHRVLEFAPPDLERALALVEIHRERNR
jgi:hypothetical protein